jgi:energy-coupling factor transporter ATP-binding protein EcfA2
MSDDQELEEFYATVGRAPDDAAAEQRGPRESEVDRILASGSTGSIATPHAAGAVRAWAASGDRYWGIAESLSRLPPGCYLGDMANDVGVYLRPLPLRTDALLTLPDSKGEKVLAEIRHFTTLRPAFVQRGLLYKRGVLLWGPPGSGKTSTLHLLLKLIVDQLGGIGLMVGHPHVAGLALQLIRKIEPERQIIAVMEDLDGMIGTHGPEQYLALLDGETQIDNVVFVATTNYPERLDRRLTDRPSRFDTVEFVGMPTEAARRAYLQHKEPALPPAVIERMVSVSDGLSIAHLRELIILTQCFGRTIDEAATRLNASRIRPPDSNRPPGHVEAGFSSLRFKGKLVNYDHGQSGGGQGHE